MALLVPKLMHGVSKPRGAGMPGESSTMFMPCKVQGLGFLKLTPKP